jgi:hypothetical protein
VWNEDNESVVDSDECSFTPASAPASWASCPSDGSLTAAVPPRNVDYLFRGRAVDGFGRVSNVITVPYNPVPCTLTHIRPMRALPFELHGAPYTLRCAPETQSVHLQIYLLGQNGHHHSLAWAVRHDQSFSDSWFVRRLTRHGRERLEPDDSLDGELKQDKTADLALVVTPAVGPRFNTITGVSVVRFFELKN